MLKIKKRNIGLYIYILPLLVMSMPAGFPNALSQPVAILLCLPAIFFGGMTTRALIIVISFTVLVFFNSMLQAAIQTNKEYSAYQALRSMVPFILLIILVLNYKSRLYKLKMVLSSHGGSALIIAEKAIGIYATLCALQTVLFFVGINLANALSMTVSGGRVMIFQTTSCILLSYYAVERKRFFVLFCIVIVVLGAGSKSVLVALFLVMLVSLLSKPSLTNIVRGFIAFAVLVASISYINPTAFVRLLAFTAGSGNNGALEDLTRAYEISHAKQSLTSSISTLLFGAGFLIQITPGVPTKNAAWAENSKYDIENGYWGVLSKLGTLITALVVFIFVKCIPFNRIIFCALIIESMMFLKTSYQIFAYMDGVYLMIWTLILNGVMSYPSQKSTDDGLGRR